MMVRKEWTVQEAQAATDAALAADPARSWADPTLPLYQWATLHEIDAERPAIDAGDGFALLGAIRKCAGRCPHEARAAWHHGRGWIGGVLGGSRAGHGGQPPGPRGGSLHSGARGHRPG